jgi:arylsulfatase A-like enzyme
MNRGRAIALGFAVMAATGATARPATTAAVQQQPAKNILVIVLDDVGTDKLSFYGETPPSTPAVSCPGVAPPGYVEPYANTPRLDALRQSGILFNSAYADPVCSPTRACFLTGRYPFRTGMGTVSDAGGYKLPDSEVLIPELLKNGFRGSLPPGLPYKCGAFGKWHLTYLTGNETHPTDNGFDRFYGSIANIASFDHSYFSWTKIEHDAGDPPPVPFTSTTWYGTATSTDASNWINAQSNAFFAYVCFNPPHSPFEVPPLDLVASGTRDEITCQGWVPGDQASATDPAPKRRLFYKAMLEAVDTEIGNLLDAIPPAKLANTMIFVMADNGTPESVMNVPPHTAGHGKATAYEWGVRVPLIVSGPLVPAPGGFVSDVPVGAVDLWRTIAAITGANPSLAAPNVTIDSVSFLPVILDPLHQPGNRTYTFSQLFWPNGIPAAPPNQNQCFNGHSRSISDGSYMYVRTQNPKQRGNCDPPTYVQQFFRIGESHEETIDLLLNGPMPPGAQATYQAMTAEMDAVSQP